MTDPRFLNWVTISPLERTEKLWGTLLADISGYYIISFLGN
jgi:hypothetical protein